MTEKKDFKPDFDEIDERNKHRVIKEYSCFFSRRGSGGYRVTYEALDDASGQDFMNDTFVFFENDITKDEAVDRLNNIISWIRQLPDFGIKSHLELAAERKVDEKIGFLTPDGPPEW